METIRNYIDSLFAGLPETAEVIKAKSELTSMMEDKYAELKNEGKSENEAIGIVISEFGNIDELKSELNLNQDTHEVKYVSEAEATNFLKSQKKLGHRIAGGIMLCILSPLLLILLDSLVTSGKISISQSISDAIGLTFLFVMVAAAVAIFIFAGFSCHKYEYISKEAISLDPVTRSKVKEKSDNNHLRFAMYITLGVILCIFSVIPLIISGCLLEDIDANEWISGIFVCTLLLMVSIGVYLFIVAGTTHGSFLQLLQEEDYTIENKIQSNKKTKAGNRIDGFYWPLVTVVYLAWSFLSKDWGITWIIWPIAAVAYWAITSIISLINHESK